jgi:HEAT repeat protein
VGFAMRKAMLILAFLIPIIWMGCESKTTKYIDALKSPSVKERIIAADSLGLLKKKRAVGPLSIALGDKYPEVQQAAEDALVNIGTASVKPLLPLLEFQKRDVRMRAAQTLGRIGDKRAVEPLIGAVRDSDVDVQKAAIDALGRIGDGRAAVPLITALQSDNPSIGDLAGQALIRIDTASVMPLIAAFKNTGNKARNRMVDVLGKIGDKRATAPLIAAIHDPDRDVQWRAVEALGRLKDPRAVEPLLADFADKSNWLRKNIAWSLGEIGDKRAVQQLIKVAEDRDSDAQRRAIEALGKIGDPSAIPVLVSDLQDWALSGTAADALGKMGWEPTNITDKVHNWVARKDKKSLVRSWNQSRQVLLNDLKSPHLWVIENALYAIVAIGKDDVSDDLVNILFSDGTRDLAQAYVNCGLETLSVIAKDWAHKKGYKVWNTGVAAPVHWGEW